MYPRLSYLRPSSRCAGVLVQHDERDDERPRDTPCRTLAQPDEAVRQHAQSSQREQGDEHADAVVRSYLGRDGPREDGAEPAYHAEEDGAHAQEPEEAQAYRLIGLGRTLTAPVAARPA